MRRNDRRGAHRYPTAEAALRLGWWEGKTFRTVPGMLRNLSISGAFLQLEDDSPPPPSRKVWLSLGSGESLPWVQAEVLDGGESAEGPARLRLRFAEPFPYEAFKTAVWGGTAKHRTDGSRGDMAESAEPVLAAAEKVPAGRGQLSELDRKRFFLGVDDDQKPSSPRERLPDPAFPDRLTHVGSRHEQMVLADRLSWITWFFGFLFSLLMICLLVFVAHMRYETVLKLAIMLGLDG